MQKVLQHLPAAQASTALALGWIVNVQARPCAFGPGLCGPGQGSPRQAAGCGRWHLRRVHESLPALVPHIARGQAAHHAVLGPFPPGHALVCAPAGHGLVARIGVAVAGFFMRSEGVKRGQRVQAGQHLGHLAHGHLQLGSAAAQVLRQVGKALLQEPIVLQRGVGLGPQAGLDHIQAKHGSALRGLGQGCVVVHPQVALEPDNGVGHGACLVQSVTQLAPAAPAHGR